MREKQRKALIELREALIGELHTLPFTVYTDANLEDLLDAQPKTIEELVKVKGFPEDGKRVKGFGEAIIAVFNDVNSVSGFSVTDIGDSVSIEVELQSMNLFGEVGML